MGDQWLELMADDPDARALYKRLLAAEATKVEIQDELARLEVEARKADLALKDAYAAHLADQRERSDRAEAYEHERQREWLEHRDKVEATNGRIAVATDLIAEKLGQIVLLLEGGGERVTGGAIYPEGGK